MKIIFLLDNNAYLEVTPENLQLRQLSVGQAALGVNLTVPLNNDDGTPKLDADGKPQTAITYYSLVNYAVDIVPAKPSEPPAPVEPPPAPTPPPVETPAPVETPTKAKRLKKKSE